MANETRNAYGIKLAELVKDNADIIVLDADLTKSTKTIEAKKVAPNQHFNAGIAECNMMGMAAGLAASGKRVFASSFAMFAAGRAYEIIRNSICYPNLNVKICATHAGLSVGEDGASHQCIEDIALMRVIPNMQVFVPSDQYETMAVIEHVAKLDGPCYVRMGRGKVEDIYDENTVFDFTKIRKIVSGSKVVVFATGLMVQEAIKVSEELKTKGIDISVVDVCAIKPLDVEGVIAEACKHEYVFVAEEHNVIGGLYSAICEAIAQSTTPKRIIPIGVNDTFGESGKGPDVLEKYGMTSKHLKEVILKTLEIK